MVESIVTKSIVTEKQPMVEKQLLLHCKPTGSQDVVYLADRHKQVYIVLKIA